MAKRFTDTCKWDKGSFMSLSAKMKLAWNYLCDMCDHAGVWDVNIKLMSFQIGENYTLEELLAGLGERVKPISPSKILLTEFVEFQYGNLNPANRVHQSILQRLQNIAPSKPLVSPLEGAKEEDKEKDSSLEGGMGETKPLRDRKFHLNTENLERANEAWRNTLIAFGCGRAGLSPREETVLARLIQSDGIMALEFACRGFAKQKKSDLFDPAQWVDITRLSNPKNFLRFVNLGVADHHRSATA